MKLEHRDCIHNARALDPWVIDALLADVPGWTAIDGILSRQFKLPDYRATIAFVNAVAQVSDTQDHHPDMTVGYATCRVTCFMPWPRSIAESATVNLPSGLEWISAWLGSPPRFMPMG